MNYLRTNLVYRIHKNEFFEIHPLNNDEIKTNKAIIGLGRSLVISKNVYQFHDKFYDLKEPGIYRFINVPDDVVQKIVPSSIGLENLSNIGHLWNYGIANKKRRFNSSQLQADELTAGCALVSAIAKEVLSLIGIESRIIRGYTNEKFNGYDDGHTMLEVMNNERKWFLYDPSFYTVFQSEGNLLNFFEFLLHKDTRSVDLKRLTTKSGHYSYKIGHKDFGMWIDFRKNNDEELLKWYRRVLRNPVVETSDGCRYSWNTSGLEAQEMKQDYFNTRELDLFDVEEKLYK